MCFLQGQGWRPGGCEDAAVEEVGFAERGVRFVSGSESESGLESKDGEAGGGGDPGRRSSGAHGASGSGGGENGSRAAAAERPPTKYDLPDATGMHELDKVGGKAGEGGQGDIDEVRVGFTPSQFSPSIDPFSKTHVSFFFFKYQ